MKGITIDHLSMRFEDVQALRNVHLEISSGEFFVLLGPSGSGKTTLLRCVAGLESPADGEIYLGDRCVFSATSGMSILPKDRNIGFVFQHYALYPHMSVFENVAFGMKIRGVPKAEIVRRVDAALAMVDLSQFSDRRPKFLSGGQQQRVAVARTIVAEPDFLLFDEPLSNLDPLLRVSVRAQLRRLHAQLNTTSIFVTHDQVEAMTLADRIGVLSHGEIVQVGTREDIYARPQTIEVAEFTGVPRTNLLRGEVHATDERAIFLPEDDPYCFISLPPEVRTFARQRCVLHLRPEAISVVPVGTDDEGVLRIVAVMAEGPETLVALQLGDRADQLFARITNQDAERLDRGQSVHLRPQRGNLYDMATHDLLFTFGESDLSGVHTAKTQRREELRG